MAERCPAETSLSDATAADTEPLVRVAGVTVSRAGNRLLDSVDLSVSSGEIVSLIGPNGAGKTTLIRVVLGLIRPDGGTVAQRPGLRVGYVPQRWAVDPVMPLTVRRLMRLTDRPDEAAMRGALSETGVERLLEQPVDTLSGGELQRVLLARALVRSPSLLVLDEPVQGVDFAGEAALYELIGRLRDRRGCGILIVSHDLHMVMGATDRVVCLNRHVCCAGAPEAVSRDPAFRALLGPRSEAYAVYRHHHDHAHTLDGEVVTEPVPDHE